MFKSKKELAALEEGLSKLEQFGFQKFGAFNEEDIFIVGYPKSGNTLLQHLVAHLVFGLKADTSKSLINSCVTEHYNNPWFFRHDKRHFFKSHELPKPAYKNVIYITRDGREAIRSYYYMLNNLNKEVSLETLYDNGGDSFVGTWNNHLKQWTENPHGANILFVRYEDLLANKKMEIERICDFLSIERTTLEIEEVMDRTSLENMKEMEKGYSWQRSKSHKTWKESGSFVREGSAQGFKKDEMVTEASVNLFVNLSEEMLKEYQYIDSI